MNDHVDPEEMLRRGMTARAHDTDPSPDLAVRIVASTEAHPATRVARRRRWDLVLGAAAAAAALLVGIAVGVRTFHTSRTGEATTTTPTLTQSVVPTPTPTATVEPRGFSATDLTWISENEGWAIGQVACTHRVPAGETCGAILHTTDGGAHWSDGPTTSLRATNIRFADEQHGFIWDASGGWSMTNDGGAHWTAGSGLALDFEMARGTVLWLTYSHAGCPGPCDVKVLRAPIGSTNWTDTQLPATNGFGADLARNGDLVTVLSLGHTAGGGSNAHSTLYVSTDAGTTWTSHADPCQQFVPGTETDSVAVSLSGDGAITLLCRERQVADKVVTAISTDAGATFRLGAAVPSGTLAMTAVSMNTIIAVKDQSVYFCQAPTTVDKVIDDPSFPTSGDVSHPKFLGFESASVGRYVSWDGQTLWTTRDGGAHWTKSSFS